MRKLILLLILTSCSVQPTPPPYQGPGDDPDPCEEEAKGKVTFEGKDMAGSVIVERCAQCHGGFTSYDVAKSKIDSMLIRVNNGSMPPVPFTITQSEIDVLNQWRKDGLRRSNECITVPPTQFIRNQDTEKAALDYVLDIELDATKKNTRCITLGYLYNLGINDLSPYRFAINKTINHLSNERQVVPLRWIGPQDSLGCLDLDDYGWDAAKWDLVESQSTVNIISKTEEGDQLRELTGTQIPVVQGGWFVHETTVAPLYYDLLIPGVQNLNQLQQFIGVNVIQCAADKDLQLAGISAKRSIVADDNRVLLRCPLEDRPGTFRRSFDFRAVDADNPERNIFAFPGKEDFGFSDSFEEAGGEIIWNLENGCQGYVVVNAAGQLLNEAPIDVVFDSIHAEAVKAGSNCMSCHNEGAKDVVDEVGPALRQNPTIGSDDLALAIGTPPGYLNGFYISANRWAISKSQDVARFSKCLTDMGGSISGEEPIGKVFYEYEDSLDLKEASVELGLRPEELRTCILGDAGLIANFQPLVVGGDVARETFEVNFQRFVDICRVLEEPSI